jgi:hypothetical protein
MVQTGSDRIGRLNSNPTVEYRINGAKLSSTSWLAPRRTPSASPDRRFTGPQQFRDYQSNTNDLANARAEFIPCFEALKTLATAAPERGGFTNSGEEFPEFEGTTHRLRPRTASLWAAQAPGDKTRARVVLLAAINGGGTLSLARRTFLCVASTWSKREGWHGGGTGPGRHGVRAYMGG